MAALGGGHWGEVPRVTLSPPGLTLACPPVSLSQPWTRASVPLGLAGSASLRPACASGQPAVPLVVRFSPAPRAAGPESHAPWKGRRNSSRRNTGPEPVSALRPPCWGGHLVTHPSRGPVDCAAEPDLTGEQAPSPAPEAARGGVPTGQLNSRNGIPVKRGGRLCLVTVGQRLGDLLLDRLPSGVFGAGRPGESPASCPPWGSEAGAPGTQLSPRPPGLRGTETRAERHGGDSIHAPPPPNVVALTQGERRGGDSVYLPGLPRTLPRGCTCWSKAVNQRKSRVMETVTGRNNKSRGAGGFT